MVPSMVYSLHRLKKLTRFSSHALLISIKTIILWSTRSRTFLHGLGLTSNEALNCRRCTEVNIVLGLFGPRRPSRGLLFSSMVKPSSKNSNSVDYYKTAVNRNMLYKTLSKWHDYTECGSVWFTQLFIGLKHEWQLATLKLKCLCYET